MSKAYSCIFYFSSGGVVMASQDGKIVFENTLDARLEVVFRKKLPEVCIVILFDVPCMVDIYTF